MSGAHNCLYIRADGNAEIGTGHIMRCLSIAQAAKEQGTTCIFITADQEMEPLIREQGFESICLHSQWNDLDQETEKMEMMIRHGQIKVLLVDSYFVTAEYLGRMHALTYVAYMDDLCAFHYSCSMLVNYNIYAQDMNYREAYPDTQLLLGCKYVPLRHAFRYKAAPDASRCVNSVLITTGGGDPFHVAVRFIHAVMEDNMLSTLQYKIVAGKFYLDLPGLMALAENYKNIQIYQQVSGPEMAQLMRTCDIAVTAGGSTLYEFCSCGIPFIMFTMADNQLRAAAAFKQRGIPYAGDIRKNDTAVVQRLTQEIRELAGDHARCWKLVNMMSGLVDGKGAQRIAFELNTCIHVDKHM